MRPELTLGRAALLGALHGPAELLPVSSSAHVTAVPVLLGWDAYARTAPEARKAFEVALHAGTSAALLVVLRDQLAEAARRPVLLALSAAPAAAAGLLLEGPIERRLGTPRGVAAGLAAGGGLMAAADLLARRGERRTGRGGRTADAATAADALVLGAAQAAALVPGLSRLGMALAAARLRGFARADADRLARQVGMPVTLGASLLKGVRLAQAGPRPGTQSRLAVGAAASCATAAASAGLLRPERALWPYAAYRIALAAAVVRRVRHTASR